MGLMNKEEKIRALDYLDQKGVFKISKTSVLSSARRFRYQNIRSTTTLRKHGKDCEITAAKNGSLLIKTGAQAS